MHEDGDCAYLLDFYAVAVSDFDELRLISGRRDSDWIHLD